MHAYISTYLRVDSDPFPLQQERVQAGQRWRHAVQAQFKAPILLLNQGCHAYAVRCSCSCSTEDENTTHLK